MRARFDARVEGDHLPEGQDSSAPDAEPPVTGEPTAAPNDPRAYEQLGEHVSTVLSSADQAAKRLQAAATEDAERIRGEAEDYARKKRAEADAYAAERQRGAEAQASAITADAEKHARDLLTTAEGKAADIQRDAVRRRESLLDEAERSEERLRNLLKVFRAMTERLENLVGSGTEGPPNNVAESDADVDAELTEALDRSRESAASSGGRRARGGTASR
jgi:hypothetical protein